MAGHFWEFVEDNVTGRRVVGATVEVYDASAVVNDAGTAVTTGSYATIYSDDGVTTVDQSASPITSGSNGFFEFWTDATSVVLQVSYGGSAKFAVTDVEIVGGTVSGDLTALAARVDKHDTVFGLAPSATDLGTFSGSTISDNTDVKTALQELETALGGAGSGDLLSTNNLSDVASASTSRSNLGAASTSQTGECIAGMILAPDDQDYKIVVKAPHGGTITETTTISASGTCTATFKINTTALGGTANSVSSSEQSQAHASSNTFSAGDDIVITVSSNASCADMSFTIKYTRTLS